jgi:hypothetical protein
MIGGAAAEFCRFLFCRIAIDVPASAASKHSMAVNPE